MSNSTQDLINEALANKLNEIFRAHNQLVESHQTMLAEMNKMTLRLQTLEERLNMICPDRSDDV